MKTPVYILQTYEMDDYGEFLHDIHGVWLDSYQAWEAARGLFL